MGSYRLFRAPSGPKHGAKDKSCFCTIVMYHDEVKLLAVRGALESLSNVDTYADNDCQRLMVIGWHDF